MAYDWIAQVLYIVDETLNLYRLTTYRDDKNTVNVSSIKQVLSMQAASGDDIKMTINPFTG